MLSNATFPELGRRTLPAWLHEAGYCTGFAGKYLNHYTQHRPRPPGWTYWEPLVGHLGEEYGYGVVRRDGGVRLPRRFITDELARVSAAQLGDCLEESRPAFVALWPVAPHEESDPAPVYADVAVPPVPRDPSFAEADLGDKPAWLQDQYPSARPAARFGRIRVQRVRTLLSVDDALTELIDRLARRGERDRTLFVLTSDNGLLLGEHRIAARKEFAYEAAQGLLWVAGRRWPRASSPTRSSTTPISRARSSGPRA